MTDYNHQMVKGITAIASIASAETFARLGKLDAAPYFLGAKLSRLLVPVPIGLIYGAFEREG
jgi:hypothetical protein